MGTEQSNTIREGTALCLSGGGYRAMLFHLGVLMRLAETKRLFDLERISSVSGGSIAAGFLGLRWNALAKAVENSGGAEPKVQVVFKELIVNPVRKLAGITIDVPSIFKAFFMSRRATDCLTDAYNRYLFNNSTLQELPDKPRFVFNATSLQTGVLARFSKPYFREWKVGMIENPRFELALAVAASSAFPPVLSPVVLDLKPEDFVPGSGDGFQKEPYTNRMVLTDGGVYDNLGLETIDRFQTIIVSNAGKELELKEKPSAGYLQQALRANAIFDQQVLNLRKRRLLEEFNSKRQKGAYFSIRSDIDQYKAKSSLPCPHSKTMDLARIDTRLDKIESLLQEKLINWGYAICDAAMRTYIDPGISEPAGFPYSIGV